jgi:hypothetical protein
MSLDLAFSMGLGPMCFPYLQLQFSVLDTFLMYYLFHRLRQLHGLNMQFY